MLINHKQKNKKSDKLNSISIKKFFFIIFSLLFAQLIFIFLVFQNMQSFRNTAFEKGFRAINVESVGSAIKRLPGAYTKTIFGNLDLPKMTIDINFKNFQKLEKKRNKSIDEGIIIQEKEDFVPAVIKLGDKKLKVKLRIKGDNIDHLIGDKWSFRVETNKDDALYGMRRFSIQNPFTRGFQGQSLIDQTRKIYGLVSLNRKLVKVIINGNDIGIMEIEEHFSKELLERNRRKESVIVRFDESDSFKYGKMFDYNNTTVDAFRSKQIKKSKQLTNYNRIATGLLRAYADGILKASDVFEETEMGMFLAINSLWGSQHGVRWGNLRFYYNPYLGKLQPIGYDDNFHERMNYNQPIVDKFFVEILKDDSIRKEYLSSLKILVDHVLNGDLISKLRSFEENYANPLFSEFYFLKFYDYSDLIKRANWISRNMFPGNADNTDIKKFSSIRNAHIYLIKSENFKTYDLQLSAAIDQEIIIDQVLHSDPLIEKSLKDFFKHHLPINLKRKKMNEKKVYSTIYNVPYEKLKKANFRITTKENDYSVFQGVQEYFPSINEQIISKNKYDFSNLEKKGIISIDRDRNFIFFNQGKWKISETIILNGFSKAIFLPGAELSFFSGAGIVSQVPIEIDAKLDKVKFFGDGKSGWFYLVDINSKSLIDGLIMNNVSAVKFGDIELLGALSIYKSKINIKNISIENVFSEDAINIIESNFTLNNCLIKNTNSDGIDTDFSEGVIKNCKFKNIGILGGGDAVDFSGSKINIENSNFNLISDKAISSGEKSDVKVDNIIIENSSVGIASKDKSKVEVINSLIKNTNYAPLMAYVKKQEYGGASIIVLNSQINSQELSKSDINSKIVIDGNLLDKSKVDTKELYDTIMKPSRN